MDDLRWHHNSECPSLLDVREAVSTRVLSGFREVLGLLRLGTSIGGGGIVKFSRRFESMGGVMVWNALHLREDKKGLLGQV